MMTRILTAATLAAVAGAAMLAISATSASAFTLSSPSLAPPAASANVQHVWYHHRHCWRGRWGHLHCTW
jgi:Spy/CpxP family protein refolding chaperone